MDLAQAYSILGVSADTPEDQLNKKFRKLAAKYHPDVNKTAEAEDMSKKINAAYNFIKENKNKPHVPSFNVQDFNSRMRWSGPFSRIHVNDIFNRFQEKEILELKTVISFAESVNGCTQKISYQRDIACKSCSGQGFHFTDSCGSCGGQGYTTKEQSMMIGTTQRKVSVREECFDCEGSGKKRKNCVDCSGSGEVKTQTSLNVHIPPGVPNEQKMRLEGQGHHVFQNSYTHAILTIQVIPEENMSLAGQDVISNIELSLLEALKGAAKAVQTVYGEKTLNVPSGSRNGDRIAIAGAGVARQGDHVFILDVKYPAELSDLVKFLEQEE